jgi:hypothetical protein
LKNRRTGENEDFRVAARRRIGGKTKAFVEDSPTRLWREKTICSARPVFQRDAGVPIPTLVMRGHRKIPYASVGAVLAALIAVCSGLYGSLHCLWGDPLRGMGGLALSVVALLWPFSFWRPPAAPELKAWQLRVGLAAVVGALVFFRFYRLVPPGIWGDDAINGLLAFRILDGEISSPFELVQHSHSHFHALTNYAIAAAFQLIEPGLTALRLPGVIASLLAGVYLVVATRALFGARVAIIAGLLFASSPLQLNHAKNLIQIVFGLMFQTAGLALLVQGITARRRTPVILAAALLAATAYTYHAAKLAPLVALPYLLAVWYTNRRERWAPTAFLALTVFAICLAPAVLSYLENPNALFSRVSGVSLLTAVRESGDAWPLWDSAWRTLAIFHYEQGPNYHWFGIGGDPALNPIVGFLALHGLVASLRGWREPRHLLLLSWFVIGLLPGFLSADAPRVYRVLLATPPIYIWAAMAVAALWNGRAPATSARVIMRTVAAMLVAGTLFADFNYYFHRVYTHPQFRWMQGDRQVSLARALRAHGVGWTGYLLNPRFSANYETMRFFVRAWDLNLHDVQSLAGALPLNDRSSAGALLLTTTETNEIEPLIRDFYPNSTVENFIEPAPRSWFFGGHWPYEPTAPRREPVASAIAVKRADIDRQRWKHGPRWQPITVEYEIGDRRHQQREPYPYHNFFPEMSRGPINGRWRGILEVPPPGERKIFVYANGRISLRIDGELVPDVVKLAPGRHEFALEVADMPKRPQLRILTSSPTGSHSLIPRRWWRPLLDPPASEQQKRR